MRRLPFPLLAVLAFGITLPHADAGPLRDRWRAPASSDLTAVAGERAGAYGQLHGQRFTLPAGVRVLRDIAYGSDPAQRFDAYIPAGATAAPVLVMVHGGGWRRGDKEMARMIESKVARWVPLGFIVVSVNYPMLPDVAPYEQAANVGTAVAAAQVRATGWGGDPARFILMGHSAGAHLVALLHASPPGSPLRTASRIQPWLGTISLDGAALNVPVLMSRRHPKLFDDAFGADPAYWVQASPFQTMVTRTAPILVVCSTERPDQPCGEAGAFVRRAQSFGTRAELLPEALSHKDINAALGLPGTYTNAVEGFMRTLDSAVAARLAP